MSCSPAQCANCNKPCATKENTDSGDVKAQLEAALDRARRAEQAFEKLKAENAATLAKHQGDQEIKPLRSQQWFNNRELVGDLGSLAGLSSNLLS